MIWHVMASHCVMVFLAPSVVMIVADVTFRNQNDVPYLIFYQKTKLIAWQCFRILYFQNRSAASTTAMLTLSLIPAVM